eukprot:741974-Amphidinium_carterae.1
MAVGWSGQDVGIVLCTIYGTSSFRSEDRLEILRHLLYTRELGHGARRGLGLPSTSWISYR